MTGFAPTQSELGADPSLQLKGVSIPFSSFCEALPAILNSRMDYRIQCMGIDGIRLNMIVTCCGMSPTKGYKHSTQAAEVFLDRITIRTRFVHETCILLSEVKDCMLASFHHAYLAQQHVNTHYTGHPSSSDLQHSGDDGNPALHIPGDSWLPWRGR